MGKTVADTVARTTEAAVDMGQRVAEQGREAMLLGVREVAGMNGRLALFSSYLTVGRGMQQMQQAWLEMLDRSAEQAAHKPQDLLRCRSLSAFAEVQCNLYLDAVNQAAEASATLLQLAAQTAQQAMRPLHGRAGSSGVRA